MALGSDQAHSSIRKAALVAGIHHRSVQTSIGHDWYARRRLEEVQRLTQHSDSFESFDLSVSKWLLVNLDPKYVLKRSFCSRTQATS